MASFARHEHELFMKYSIPLALLSAVRTPPSSVYKILCNLVNIDFLTNGHFQSVVDYFFLYTSTFGWWLMAEHPDDLRKLYTLVAIS